MAAEIETELSVGLTAELMALMPIVAKFYGMKPSQIGRQALVEKFVREGFMKHPMQNIKSPDSPEVK